MKIGILGATGAVGEQMRECLVERNIDITELRLMASERSVGKKFSFKGEEIPVIAIDDNAFGYVGLFNNTTVLRKGVSGFAEYVPFDFYGVDAETDING